MTGTASCVPVEREVTCSRLYRFYSYGVRGEVTVRGFTIDQAALADLLPETRWSDPVEREQADAPDIRFEIRPSAASHLGAEPRFDLLEDGEAIVCGVDRASLICEWQGALENAVARLCRTLIFVHAGVVAWNNRAIVLPGQTHSGKSTLVVELLRLGCNYYSDEFALLDPQGCIHPFRRAPKLRGAAAKTHARFAIAPNSAVSPSPLAPGLVLFSEFRESESWQARRLTAAETMIYLIQNTVAIRGETDRAIQAVSTLSTLAPGWHVSRGEAVEAAPKILTLLGEP